MHRVSLIRMQHEMTIEPATGAVSISGIPCALSAGLSREVVAAGLAALVRSERDLRNGYAWLEFAGLSFGGKPAWASVCFHRGRLSELHWSVSLRDDVSDTAWPTREECDREVAFLRAALLPMLGRSFSSGGETFPWGVMWANFDERGGFAGAGLRYTADTSSVRGNS